MKIIYLTAGAAGMVCGSCLHDNALAKSLRAAGHECVLQPLYTPIRTDTPSVASDRLFFGGIHIYLLQKLPWLSHLPPSIKDALRWPLNFPPLVRYLTRRSASVDAASLGDLTVSMLRGTAGRQSDEAHRLIDWIATEQPDMLLWSNLLIAGTAPDIRYALPDTQQIAILQGDDIFLDHLGDPHRRSAIDLIRGKAQSIDRLIVNSRFYARLMSDKLGIAPERFEVHPLTIEIDSTPLKHPDSSTANQTPFRIGYMARIAPEKGLHILVDAFIEMSQTHPNIHLHVAGYLGQQNADYFNDQIHKIAVAGLADRFTHHGEVDHHEKRSLLNRIDVLSVPTTYAEPKGLFVLESLAEATPVIQPDHGAFPELIQSTAGGLLFPPGNPTALAEQLIHLHDHPKQKQQLGTTGQKNVHQKHNIQIATNSLLTP